MSTKAKPGVKQPPLFRKTALAPIKTGDALSIDALTHRYRCSCGNEAMTGIKLEAIVCTRCGAAMLPIDDAEPRGRDPPPRP